MCMSPHEMSTERIEELVASMRKELASGMYGRKGDGMYRYWEGRLENYEKLLKERAEAGTL